ncbi:MAG: chemotaxis protein CheB, partial [Sphingobacteriales bacterium]
WTIAQHGGLTIVQTPEDAEQPQLPENALEVMDVDFTLAAADMPPLLAGIVSDAAPKKHQFTKEELKLLKTEVIIASRDGAFEMGIMNMGEFTPFTCPECHGALVQLKEGNIVRFRCHTGHAYTASSLLSEVTESVEGLLWQCMRGLEETDMLLKSIAQHFSAMKNTRAVALYREKSEEVARRARVIQDSIFRHEQISEDARLKKRKK